MEFDTIIQDDCLNALSKLPNNLFDLVILDPPYWKVVATKWDFQWRVLEDWVNWCKKWLAEAVRICKPNSSLYIFGYTRNLISLHESISCLGFNYRQPITISKGLRSLGGRKTSTYQMFPTTTEMLWFYRRDIKPLIKKLLKERQKVLGLSSKEINEKLGTKSNGGGVWSLYTGNNILAQVPTQKMWDRLQRVLEFQYSYKNIRTTFNIEMGLTDVWSDIDFYAEKRYHPTQKPVALMERIIKASSNKGDIILDPFIGSGSTAIACKKLNRKYIGIENSVEYCNSCQKRLSA